jgi:hypothetical protein
MTITTQINNVAHYQFVITYVRPYTNQRTYQSFNTLEEANRMIDFYKSCGTFAELMTW